jgi:predicted nicotinamide N-methyase
MSCCLRELDQLVIELDLTFRCSLADRFGPLLGEGEHSGSVVVVFRGWRTGLVSLVSSMYVDLSNRWPNSDR